MEIVENLPCPPSPTVTPSSAEFSGRDAVTGRFVPGNKVGQGNPYKKRVGELRAAMYEAITKNDVREILASMIECAKRGDVPAAKLVLGYVVSTPINVGGDEDGPEDTVAVVAKIPRDKAIALLREHS